MVKWFMLEVAVCVDTDLDDDEAIDKIDVNVDTKDGVKLKEFSIENSYEFCC